MRVMEETLEQQYSRLNYSIELAIRTESSEKHFTTVPKIPRDTDLDA